MSQTYSPDRSPTSRVWIALIAVWLAFTANAVAFVVIFGSNAPYADEWAFVPALVGEEPVGPWLWQQHNEHRLPLPRAIYFVLFQLTHDFRSGMLLQVLMLSALSLGLMRVAARLRGRAAWFDAFFPVSLLHLGHWENFIMGYQICFVLFTVFVMGLVVVALQTTRENAFRSGVWAGVLLLLVALTGGAGLPLVPPVAAWLMYLAVIVWRSGQRRRALTFLGLAVLPIAYLGMYFVGYERPAYHPPISYHPIAVGAVAEVVMSLALGIGLSAVWDIVFVGELLLGMATVVMLLRRPREDRASSFGLIAVAAGVCGLAVAIGMGRAAWGPTRMLEWPRYSLLMWPLLGAAFLAWVKVGGWGGKWIPAMLCLASALAFPANTGTGMFIGHDIHKHFDHIAADAQKGLSAEEIVSKNFPDSPNGGEMEAAVRAIPLLRANRIGIFAGN